MSKLPERAEILQGTLDLMVLQTLASLGPLNGYAIARRIEQVSRDAIHLNQGTIYPALIRLHQAGWISAEWGTSDNNRKAKFYSITKSGQRELSSRTAQWERIASTVQRLIEGVS